MEKGEERRQSGEGKGKNKSEEMDKRHGLNLQDLEAGRRYRKRQVADLWRMSTVAIHEHDVMVKW